MGGGGGCMCACVFGVSVCVQRWVCVSYPLHHCLYDLNPTISKFEY